MFSNNDDDFHDLRRQEEYERQKNEQLARGVGNFLYRYIVYSMIWFLSALFISMLLNVFF